MTLEAYNLLAKQYKELVEDHNEQTVVLCNLQTKYIDLKIECEKLQQELAQEKQKNIEQQSINKYGNGRGG